MSCPMKKVAALSLLVLLALVSVQLDASSLGSSSSSSRRLLTERALQQQQAATPAGEQQEPSPEPYSFSYGADSLGGSATRQETGDSSGRVTGFYTIEGEDGRERRVDYVADENGYRASIFSNEVGLRASEPSADVQLDVQLPSAKQLEAAKSTYEEYKYLEQVHATERERQLARLGQRQQQATTGQQEQFRESASPAYFGTSGASNRQQQGVGQLRLQASQSFNSNSGRQLAAAAMSWAPQQPSGNQAATVIGGQASGDRQAGQWAQAGTASDEADLGWRQRGKSLASNKSLGSDASQPPGAVPASSGPPAAAASVSATNQDYGAAGAASANQFSSSVSQSSSSSSPQSAGLNSDSAAAGSSLSASTAQLQQQQLLPASWQQKTSASGNWQTAGPQLLGVTRGNGAQQQQLRQLQPNTELQRQLEQQFLQEAVQLTDQDYPRQATMASAATGAAAASSSTDLMSKGQLQPQAMTFGQEQQAVVGQLQIDGPHQNIPAAPGQQEGSGQQTTGTWTSQQRATSGLGRPQAAANTEQQQAALITSSGQSATVAASGDYAQYNQQQNNIINDIGSDQIDYATVQEDAQISPQSARQPQQLAASVKRVAGRPQSIEATTTTSPIAGGLVAINLNESGEQDDQEVSRTSTGSRPSGQWLVAAAPQPQQQRTGQSFIGQSLSEVSSATGSRGSQQQAVLEQQNVEIQREEPQRIPNSVNQIIDSLTKRPASLEHQQVVEIARTATKTRQPEQELLPQSQYGVIMRQTTITSSGARPTATSGDQQQRRVQELLTTTSGQASFRPTAGTSAPSIAATTTLGPRRPTVAVTTTTAALPIVDEEATTTEAAPIRAAQPQAQKHHELTISAAGVKGKGGSLTQILGQRNRYNSTIATQQQQLSEVSRAPFKLMRAQQTEQQQVLPRQPIATRAPTRWLPEQRFTNQATYSMMTTATTSGQKHQQEERPHVEHTNSTARATGGSVASTATTGGSLQATSGQQQQQWKAGTKGGSKTAGIAKGRQQFWRQQTAESATDGGDQWRQQQSRAGGGQSSVAGANDYAASLGYGSRVRASRSGSSS